MARGRRVLAASLLAVIAAGGCTLDDGPASEAHGDQPVSIPMTPPGLPPRPGALVDLRGFHEGRMRLPDPTSVRLEPDSELLEVRFVSDDGGELFLRGRGFAAGEPGPVTVAFEVAEHVSAPNKRARRYQSSDEECVLTLADPFEVGTEVAGSFVCQHVSGELGSLQDLAGSFRTGILLPASGRADA